MMGVIFFLLVFIGTAHADDTAYIQGLLDRRAPIPVGTFIVDCVPGQAYALRLPDRGIMRGAARDVTRIVKNPLSTRVCDLVLGDGSWYVTIADVALFGGATTRRVIHNHGQTAGWTIENVSVRESQQECVAFHWATTLALNNIRFAQCGWSALRTFGEDESGVPQADKDVRLSNLSMVNIGGGIQRAAISLSGTSVVMNLTGTLPSYVVPVLFRDGQGKSANVLIVTP